jgi:predicted HNH restriction endonuclease
MIHRYRKRYPDSWEELAQACKERAGWRCEHCCVEQYALVESRKGTPYLVYLHAAHKHHDPGNPHPELLCLCASCHARYDYAHKQREARVRLEILKHLRLLIAAGHITVKEETYQT